MPASKPSIEEIFGQAQESCAKHKKCAAALRKLQASMPFDAFAADFFSCVACVLPGDLCVFSSAALHFASNGADGVSAALFHGIVTDASLPRLVEAARRGSGGADDQMSAADVLRQIAQRK